MNEYYSYSYLVIFGRPNIIRIHNRSLSEDRILFVVGHFRKAEYYSYSYSVIFGRPNIIRIRIRSFSEGRIIFVFVFVFGLQNTIRSPLLLCNGDEEEGKYTKAQPRCTFPSSESALHWSLVATEYNFRALLMRRRQVQRGVAELYLSSNRINNA